MSKTSWNRLPEEFWSRHVVADAVARGDIGAIAHLIIKERRMTETELGAVSGYSQTQISLWIHHKRAPNLVSQVKFLSAVGMPSATWSRLPVPVPEATAGNPLPTVKLHKLLRLAEQIGRTGDPSLLAAWRELTAPGGRDVSCEILARVIGEHHMPEEPVFQRMTYRTRGLYFVAARLPARLVIRGLTAHLRDVVLLLDASDDVEQRRKLAVIGGESSYLAACCDVDLGAAAGALDLLDTVALVAERTGDRALAAITLDGQSHLQAFLGHRRRCLELVEQAQACAADVSRGTTAYLWLRMAEAHAALGHARNAARAWEQAELHYACTNVQADRNWVRLWLSRDGFDSVRAVIYVGTGRCREGVDCAARVATRLAGEEGKSAAVALINAALAQARCGLHKPAAVTGALALHAVRASEASSCLARAHEVADLIKPSSSRVPEVGAYRADLDHTHRWFQAQLGL